MRSVSLRGWLLAISVLFALLVVGGISLTTYVILSDGMQVVAYNTTERIASSAVSVMRGAVNDAEMLDEAHWSFAMANAHPGIQERANYLAPSSSDAGLVTVLAHLLGG